MDALPASSRCDLFSLRSTSLIILILFERYFWHVIFGEPLWLPRRHRDARLPLFMRMLNIEAEAVVEAQRGEDGPGAVIHFTQDAAGADDTYHRLQSLFA